MALSNGFNITGLTIVAGGSGFANSTTFNLVARDPGQGSGFAGTCTSNGSGVITSTSISSAGANYSSGSWSYVPIGSAINTVTNSGAYTTAWGVTGSTKFYLNSGTFSPTNKKFGFFDSDYNFQVLSYGTFTASGPSYVQNVSGWKRFVNSSTTPTIANGTSIFNVERGGTGHAGAFTSIGIQDAGSGHGCIIVPTIGFNNSIDVDSIRTEKGDGQGNNDIHDLYQAFNVSAKVDKKNFDWYEDGPEAAGTLETHPIRFDEFFSAEYDAYAGSGCFSVDTPISLPDGITVPIEDLFVGQEVMAMSIPTMPLDFDDEDTWKEWETDTLDEAEQVTATVKEIYFDWYKDYYLINKRIKTTFEHPFLVKRDGKYKFVITLDLQVGDEFVTNRQWLIPESKDGAVVFEKITSIDRIYEELETVNINCEPHDVYFAGGVLAHNVHDK